jgi:DNA excision repair protein ERCC-3
MTDSLLNIPRLARVRGPRDIKPVKTEDLDIFFSQQNNQNISLKENSSEFPLWVSSDGKIFLENFNKLSQQAYDFLVAISEPISRPAFIHEYRMTPYSLFAAVSIGLETNDIIGGLDRLSKNSLSQELIDFVIACTKSYGKVKIVLKENRYWIESAHIDILRTLLKDPIIFDARDNQYSKSFRNINSDFVSENDVFNSLSFPIKTNSVESIKKRCIELDFPLLEEYDYLNDPVSPFLQIDLKPATQIRTYQEKALGKMFAHGRARSGIIVLPCGAGKTLVGITAMSTIKKNTLILCTSGVAVEQWKQQIKLFSTLPDTKMAKFVSDNKEKIETESSQVIISTYSMIAYSGRRSYIAKKSMDSIKSIEWGLVILDEVHVVPANVFRKVISSVAAHTKLGLTATLVREDDKIEDLNFLIGPKLYEANWQDLADQGHIAQVQCAEVWCDMTPEFYSEYLRVSSRIRRLLYAVNPNKFHACQYLINYHESRGDKTIVFSDNLYSLNLYAKKLKRLSICGATSQSERLEILHQFQTNPNINTIFISKVGDTSIDLPEATCLIQISSHFGSRRQEAQRLGRILRAKRRFDMGFFSYFYTLVSKDTEEMYYSTKRQQFLIDQGYSFKVITHLSGIEEVQTKAFHSLGEQISLLQEVLLITEYEEEDIIRLDDFDDTQPFVNIGSLKTISGVGDMAHMQS